MNNKLYKSLCTIRVFETHNHSCLNKGQKTRVYIALRLKELLKITKKTPLFAWNSAPISVILLEEMGYFTSTNAWLSNVKRCKSQRETHFSILSTPSKADIIAIFLLLFFYLLPFLSPLFLANKHNKNSWY